MKIAIKRIDIEDNPANEVTSYKVFRPRKVRGADGTLMFHEDGIFSERIFGKYGHCNCETNPLTKPGICPVCGCRVISKKVTPDYYIKIDELDVPFITIDYAPYTKLTKTLKGLMNYEGFLYDGVYHKFDLDKMNPMDYDDQDKILIGRDAVIALGVDPDWYDSQVTHKIYVPHPSFRQITTVGKKHYLGSLNTALIKILKKKHQLKQYLTEYALPNKFFELNAKRELILEINLVYDELFNMLAKRKKSIISREVRGQSLTGAVRGVLTNNFGLDEDTVILGKYFIKTLYPELYAKYTPKALDEHGQETDRFMTDKTDIKALNEELKNKSYYVLVNRPPTIGEKSIIAMHPVFSEKDSEKYVIQMNPISFDGLAADTDGDCVLVIALYTTDACKEAEALLPSKNYIGGANDEIRNGLPEDFVYVMLQSYLRDDSKSIEDIINGGAE